jgi:DNA primase
MRIPESTISDISAAADIVRIISDHVELKPAGKDYRGLCPFHGDNDPSFYVSPQKGIFYCFGCATGGSVFNFLMKIKGITFVEAVKEVGAACGVTVDIEPGAAKGAQERSRLLEVLEFANQRFKDDLKRNGPALDYLRGRGLSAEQIKEVEIGYADEKWDSLTTRLAEKRFAIKDSMAAGLVRERKQGRGHYDYFRSRIMIPIRELSGDLIAFGGRILGEGEPKYLNSPESSLFRKRRALYGLNDAREAIRKEGFVILVEGYFDQIGLRIHGIGNVAAPLGVALSEDQIRLLKRFTDRMVVIFDSDEAGINAVKRSIPIFLSQGVEPRCLALKDDKDPDEAVARMGPDAFRELVDNAGSIIDLFLESLEGQYDFSTLSGRNLALEEALPTLRPIANSKEGDYLIERISSRTRIRENRIRNILAADQSPRKRDTGIARSKRTIFDFPTDERIIVRGMMIREGFLARVKESGLLKEINDPTLVSLARRIIDFYEQQGRFSASEFAGSVEEEKLASTVAAFLNPRPQENDIPDGEDGDRLLEDTLARMNRRRLERRKSEIQRQLRKCSMDDENYKELALELTELSRTLHNRAQTKT